MNSAKIASSVSSSNYLCNSKIILISSSKYLADWLEWNHQQVKAQHLNPSPTAIRMRKLRAEQRKKEKEECSSIS
ncbi:MAG: hypothetical protein RIB93_32820 [Coleofasciculus sp. D1-CHI-01]|uniref:hypothetical protein n=1 Tax=Coleofasciculus sp. D1-CHI-01 TaxID=3068482 RepID=UPI0032F5B3B0